MKNLLYLPLVAIAILFFSCGDDDDSPEIGLSGMVTFDSSSTEMSDGLIVDYGSFIDETYNYDFYLGNGTIEINENTGTQSTGGTLILLELYNNGSSFSPGTFTIHSVFDDIDNDERYGYVAFTNKDFSNLNSAGGTVKIEGSGQSYTITLDVEFSNGKTLTGSVEGGFRLEEAITID
ncbi:MAG: hypothetical protein AAF600_15110 [Bacteroidota bacterium]